MTEQDRQTLRMAIARAIARFTTLSANHVSSIINHANSIDIAIEAIDRAFAANIDPHEAVEAILIICDKLKENG